MRTKNLMMNFHFQHWHCKHNIKIPLCYSDHPRQKHPGIFTKTSRQMTTLDRPNWIKKHTWQVEFTFAQIFPVVCLPCRQTTIVFRIIADLRVLLYRLTSKKSLKSKNTRSKSFQAEVTFSFDQIKLQITTRITCNLSILSVPDGRDNTNVLFELIYSGN